MDQASKTRVISTLGIVMIFSWGTTYYLLAVLSAPIQLETGWSSAEVASGLSIGLLTSGLVAQLVGRVIAKRGGRLVLTGGMLLIAAGLVALSLSRSLAMYWFAWIILGAGMGAGLYDAAFSTLGRLFGTNARSAITNLTLWGGFASTVCWPIANLLVEVLGWRYTCLAFAALHLLVTAPLCAIMLPRSRTAEPTIPAALMGAPAGSRRSGSFWLIAAASIVLAMIASFWSVHVITVLTAGGYATSVAVGLAAMIGPAQVAARILEKLSGGRYHPIWTLLISTALVCIGFVGLSLGVHAGAALVAYGAGNGLWSIARGTLPLVLFGPDDYPRIMGSIAAPTLIAAAFAPTIGAALMQTFGMSSVALALALAASIPLFAAAMLLFRLKSAQIRA